MPILPLAAGLWQFRDSTRRSPWRDAAVPGCVHRDLLRHAAIPDPFWANNELELQWIGEHEWEYRTTFQVPPECLDEEHVDLVADGLDTVSVVTLNGHEVGRTDNMFVAHRWDVKSRIRRGRNELAVRFLSAPEYIRHNRLDHRPREFNDPVGRCTVIRKQQCQFGWDWGPRLITAGIWRDIRLHAWTGNRLESVKVTQRHEPAVRDKGAGTAGATSGRKAAPTVSSGRKAPPTVTLLLEPELAIPEDNVTCRWELVLQRVRVARGTGNRIVVEHPQLWWPNGHGAQPLYDLQVEVSRADGSVIGRWNQRIGLRTLVLDRHVDEWGESFRFVVNGRPVFAKGANWIPAHTFVAGLSRDEYARDLRSAAAAHMNMLRVWGGGIYESEDFYDLCDELGLMVWQDFMFACTLYPADDAFLQSLRVEAGQQVRRLRNRACLALWCGNNEVFGLNVAELKGDPRLMEEYNKVFHGVLPQAVAENDPATAYWPSSPWSGSQEHGHTIAEERGDTHYWDVWHARHPVKDYEKWRFRFVSEFGMQSYSSPATNATFCPPGHGNVFGPEMENHQKNRAGNQIILDYVSRRFRFPKSQDDLVYLSQLNQADCIQTGVEHYRRLMPRCMGALYWQLNDCWPVASWSSIEFTGRWKALHHIARRFYSPALVTAHVPGDEVTTIGNYRQSTAAQVHLYTVYDHPRATHGTLRWDLFHLGGRVVLSGTKRVALRPGESVSQKTLDLADLIARHGRDKLYLRIALDVAGSRVSEETVFLTPPRFIELPRATTAVKVHMAGPLEGRVTFTSAGFQHRFAFDLPGLPFEASDNYFELYPREPKSIMVRVTKPATAQRLRRLLVHHSLVDTYER